MSERLFVYGTLRRDSGHPMARVLAARAQHVGPGRVAGRLYDLGPYPGAVPSDVPGEWVFGDVYALTDPALWSELDAYEAAESPRSGGLFARSLANAESGGDAGPVWVYWYLGATPESARVGSGVYDTTTRSAGS